MKTTLAPDYAGSHDAAYRKLRAAGAQGWDADDAYAGMLDIARPAIEAARAAGSVSILEIGCGAGDLSLRLAGEGHAVTGVDISPVAVGWAQEKASGASARFIVDDVTRLAALDDGAFDVVVDGHCLHCIIGADRASAMAAVGRVLRPGGRFVVMTMCGEVTNEKVRQDLAGDAKTLLRDGRPGRYVADAEEVVGELAAAGFVIESRRVDPRQDASDQDMLVVVARRPV